MILQSAYQKCSNKPIGLIEVRIDLRQTRQQTHRKKLEKANCNGGSNHSEEPRKEGAMMKRKLENTMHDGLGMSQVFIYILQ